MADALPGLDRTMAELELKHQHPILGMPTIALNAGTDWPDHPFTCHYVPLTGPRVGRFFRSLQEVEAFCYGIQVGWDYRERVREQIFEDF